MIPHSDEEFAKVYHFSSRNQGKGHLSFSDDNVPEAWKTIQYKEYPRMKVIALPEPAAISAELGDILSRRTSQRKSMQDVSLTELSSLIAHACGISSDPTRKLKAFRTYPSAGGLYALEMYILHAEDAPSFARGAYHYNIRNHTLEFLTPLGSQEEFLGSVIAPAYDWIYKAPILIVFTTTFSRLQQKYGERAYRYMLLEAGHAGQNLYLVSEALKLQCCALGGVPDSHIEKILDLDPEKESLVYTMVIGKTG